MPVGTQGGAVQPQFAPQQNKRGQSEAGRGEGTETKTWTELMKERRRRKNREGERERECPSNGYAQSEREK